MLAKNKNKKFFICNSENIDIIYVHIDINILLLCFHIQLWSFYPGHPLTTLISLILRRWYEWDNRLIDGGAREVVVEGEAGGDRHVVVEGEGGRRFLAAGGVHAQINAFGRDNVATIRLNPGYERYEQHPTTLIHQTSATNQPIGGHFKQKKSKSGFLGWTRFHCILSTGLISFLVFWIIAIYLLYR